ncbi:hypothetical protein ACJRO7_009407 [Eucalyptus globulus]|uniref:Uncharacterized protein n=1 Tax=Eucalyptus globulus TaxID=34317 RepID=A0ABD3L9G6_EUCGL
MKGLGSNKRGRSNAGSSNAILELCCGDASGAAVVSGSAAGVGWRGHSGGWLAGNRDTGGKALRKRIVLSFFLCFFFFFPLSLPAARPPQVSFALCTPL